jgi:UDP-N-acetylmuramate dehydrogenase
MQENVLLKNYSTFKIGGPAKYFCVVKNKDELIGALAVSQKLNLPFFILGGGSNILISDDGFLGLVIKMQNTAYHLENDKIFAGGGIKLGELTDFAQKNNLTGLEWARGVPGTLGGAIYGNAGAFGGSIADSIKRVEIFDIRDKKIKFFSNKDCQFNYRQSIFRENKSLIILSAELLLKKSDKKEVKNKTEEFLKYRKENQPLDFPSAGSVFKNPTGFFAADLIEKCGLKGKIIGGAKISEKHTNFIVNYKNASAKDVKELIDLAKKLVKEKFGVVLEEEIQYLGLENLKK